MAATLSFSPFHFDHAGSTRMLKDFLQESNGNGESRTASFKHAVKGISFPSVNLRRILPRSLSRRLLGKRERDDREIGSDFVVKVKDIIRWRSFRDLVDETAEMAASRLDFADSPDRYTAAATTTTTTTATSSNSSSWCESDFTADDLPSPSWRGCSDDGETGNIYFPCVGEDSVETTATNSQNDKKVNAVSRSENEEDEEQNVTEERAALSRSFRLVELFQRERPYCQEREGDGEWDQNSGEIGTMKAKEDGDELFRRELRRRQESESDEEGDQSNVKIREGENEFEWILSQAGKRSCLREMEREGKWGVFGDEEREELGLDIEGGILGCLVHEILLDIFQL